jgi:guanylate kinase
LKSEVQRIWDEGGHVVFDVDVVGGVNLKSQLKDRALGVFIKVGDKAQLRARLKSRDTDSDEEIEKRVQKATEEMTYEKFFDHTIVNDELDQAILQAEKLVDDFLHNPI